MLCFGTSEIAAAVDEGIVVVVDGAEKSVQGGEQSLGSLRRQEEAQIDKMRSNCSPIDQMGVNLLTREGQHVVRRRRVTRLIGGRGASEKAEDKTRGPGRLG